MTKFLFALSLILSGFYIPEDSIASNMHTLMCQKPDGGFYFVNWKGLRWILKGVNGKPDGVVFLDTAGNTHVLYQGMPSPDRCEDAGDETEV